MYEQDKYKRYAPVSSKKGLQTKEEIENGIAVLEQALAIARSRGDYNQVQILSISLKELKAKLKNKNKGEEC